MPQRRRVGLSGAARIPSLLAGVVLLLVSAGCVSDPEPRTAPPVVRAEVRPAPLAQPEPSPRDERGPPIPLVEPDIPEGPQPVIERGTGVFIEREPAPRTAAEVTDGEVTLNFINADVREVIRVVLGDILDRNYVVSPGVTGTVTIQTSEPIPQTAVLDVLERALRLSGASLVMRQGLIEVVPSELAGHAGASIELGPRARGTLPGYGIEVIPLEYIGAAEMRTLLQPVIAADTLVEVEPQRNLLIVAGTRAQRSNVAELVQSFDVDWLRGRSVGLFPLEFANADAIVEELRSIFAVAEGEAISGVVRFSPIQRLNAVLTISTQPAYLERAATWIRRLDQGLGETSPQVFVYYVQNKRAADLAEVLSQIFAPREARLDRPVGEVAPGRTPVAIGGAPRARGLDLQPGTRPLAARRAGQLSVADQEMGAEPAQTERTPRSLRQRGRGAAGTVAAPEEAPVPVAPSLGAPDEPLAPAISGAPPGAAVGPDGEVLLAGEDDIRIIADDSNNALVVLATPRDYRRVEAALRRLDITPLQVLIEATIAEVTLNDNLDYGLQWFFESGDFAARLGETTAGVINPVFPGFSAVFSGADARVVLNAIASVTDLNVISAPQVLVLDNQTAVLQVGDQVPVPVRQVVPFDVVDPQARSIVNAIEFRDTGTILLVTPRVNAGGLVTLEIEQEVSDAVQTVTSGIDAPTIQRRLIQTTVAVDSGETLALGGLIRDRSSQGRSGVPVLMDIPVLGALFSRTTDSTQRTEILVLITPRVVRNTEDARAVTSELRQRLRSLAPLERKIYMPPPPAPRAM